MMMKGKNARKKILIGKKKKIAKIKKRRNVRKKNLTILILKKKKKTKRKKNVKKKILTILIPKMKKSQKRKRSQNNARFQKLREFLVDINM
jgi:hypothetical protein